MAYQTASQDDGAEAMLRIGTVMGIPQVLRNLGLNPDKVLTDGGFDPALFNDPDNLISFTARSQLMAYCAVKAQCPDFAILVGQQAGLHSLGLLGLLAQYSPDVLSALNTLVRYFHLQSRASGLNLQVNDGTAILSYQIHQGQAQANNQIGAGAVAILHNIMHELCGPSWKPVEAHFIQQEPENSVIFKQFFKVKLHFNAIQNALIFHSSWLSQTLPEVHPDLRKLIKKQIDALADQNEESFPEQVRRVLRSALPSGRANVEQVSALFSMHPRTLNRHLHAFDTNFQELANEIRFDIARQVLSDSKLEISELALMLDYADARSFIRAFKRWSGETPARWRATQKLACRIEDH